MVDEVIRDGESVLITTKGRSWLVNAQKGKRFSTHRGVIEFDKVINQLQFGTLLKLGKPLTSFLLLKPTPCDLIEHFKLKTQRMYLEDSAVVVATAGLGHGSRVIEAGSGSGALTAYLAHSIRPDGHVYSYETDKNRLATAQKNIKRAGLSQFVTWHLADVTKDVQEKDVDAWILDMPNPWDAVDCAEKSLKLGGHLIVFVPNWGQVERSFSIINSNSFWVKNVFEILRRDFRVSPDRRKPIMHPEPKMVGFSGIIIDAIRITTQE